MGGFCLYCHLTKCPGQFVRVFVYDDLPGGLPGPNICSFKFWLYSTPNGELAARQIFIYNASCKLDRGASNFDKLQTSCISCTPSSISSTFIWAANKLRRVVLAHPMARTAAIMYVCKCGQNLKFFQIYVILFYIEEKIINQKEWNKWILN